jgi:hypothetical protein
MLALCLVFIIVVGVLYSRCRQTLVIDQPANGAHVIGPSIVVRGHTSPHAKILRDVRMAFDPEVTVADDEGFWSCVWYLRSGENTIRLHTAGNENHVTLTVYNDGPASPQLYGGCLAVPVSL